MGIVIIQLRRQHPNLTTNVSAISPNGARNVALLWRRTKLFNQPSYRSILSEIVSAAQDKILIHLEIFASLEKIKRNNTSCLK